MQQFSHSELSRSFDLSNRLAYLVFTLCFMNFAMFANESKDLLKTNNPFPISVEHQHQLQSSSSNHFVLEEIPGKYKVLKAVIDGEEIFIRRGRLEMFLNPADPDESTYLMFMGCDMKIVPVGVNKLSESRKDITNPAMASALQETSMKVTTFEKIVYKDLYTGVALELSIGTNGLKSTLITTNKKQAISDFQMKFSSPVNLESKEKSFQLRSSSLSKSVEIISGENKLKTNSLNKMQFSANNNSIENLTFDIILK